MGSSSLPFLMCLRRMFLPARCEWSTTETALMPVSGSICNRRHSTD